MYTHLRLLRFEQILCRAYGDLSVLFYYRLKTTVTTKRTRSKAYRPDILMISNTRRPDDIKRLKRSQAKTSGRVEKKCDHVDSKQLLKMREWGYEEGSSCPFSSLSSSLAALWLTAKHSICVQLSILHLLVVVDGVVGEFNTLLGTTMMVVISCLVVSLYLR